MCQDDTTAGRPATPSFHANPCTMTSDNRIIHRMIPERVIPNLLLRDHMSLYKREARRHRLVHHTVHCRRHLAQCHHLDPCLHHLDRCLHHTEPCHRQIIAHTRPETIPQIERSCLISEEPVLNGILEICPILHEHTDPTTLTGHQPTTDRTNTYPYLLTFPSTPSCQWTVRHRPPNERALAALCRATHPELTARSGLERGVIPELNQPPGKLTSNAESPTWSASSRKSQTLCVVQSTSCNKKLRLGLANLQAEFPPNSQMR